MSLPPPPGTGKLTSPPPSVATSMSGSPRPAIQQQQQQQQLQQQQQQQQQSSMANNANANANSGGGLNGTTATPRKGQGARKQHRNQKRAGGNRNNGGNNNSGNSGNNSGNRNNNSNNSGNRNNNNNSHHFRRADFDDALAEQRAVRNASSRRGQTSITHLLNYSVRQGGQDDYRGYGGGGGGYSGYGGSYGYRSRHHGRPVDKTRFVHANYRFVVSPTGDYTAQATDADEHLPWDGVLQVLASAVSQTAACPICLSEPVAPRMAKCGHIFCLPCLIRFMHVEDNSNSNSSSNNNNSSSRNISNTNTTNTTNTTTTPTNPPKKRWKKCPICEDSIYLHDVRPVRFYAGQECVLPRPGDDVVLRLMLRHAHSTVALPREEDNLESSPQKLPWHFAANVLDCARIMRGTGDYMVAEYDRELDALEQQEREDELLFQEDNEWTQRSMKAVRTAQEQARSLGGMELAVAETVGARAGSSTQASRSESTRSESTRPESTRPESTRPESTETQDFYFYAAPPHLYLSPLDIRILKTQYGAFASFPSTLLPRVEHVATGHVVDDALRRRAKYLGHLPAGCEVAFLECDWTDIVSSDILAGFADDLARRRKRNRDKAAQEERERQQAERVAAAALRTTRRGGNSNGNPSGDVRDDDAWTETVVDLNDFQPLESVHANTTSSTTPTTARPQTGFAHFSSMSTSPSTGRTVWGTPAVAHDDDVWGDDFGGRPAAVDGWLDDAQLLHSLGGADGTGVGVTETKTDPLKEAKPSNNNNGGNKKKKKQKITLMSTGMHRGN